MSRSAQPDSLGLPYLLKRAFTVVLASLLGDAFISRLGPRQSCLRFGAQKSVTHLHSSSPILSGIVNLTALEFGELLLLLFYPAGFVSRKRACATLHRLRLLPRIDLAKIYIFAKSTHLPPPSKSPEASCSTWTPIQPLKRSRKLCKQRHNNKHSRFRSHHHQYSRYRARRAAPSTTLPVSGRAAANAAIQQKLSM